MQRKNSDISRFEEFKELEDNTGFKIPTGEIFKLDSEGGWFDEFGSYFNAEGLSDKPSESSLKEKRRLMNEQRLATKLDRKGHQNLEDVDLPEAYDVVRI